MLIEMICYLWYNVHIPVMIIVQFIMVFELIDDNTLDAGIGPLLFFVCMVLWVMFLTWLPRWLPKILIIL